MSQQFDNNMTGIISKNDRKESDAHPDIKGQAEIDGKQYWVAGWRKERKDGSGSFYSLRFEAKDAPKQAPRAKITVAQDDDDLPFADPYKGRRSYVV